MRTQDAIEVIWLGDARCHDPAVVGGKAAPLSRLIATQPVPPGFCVQARAQHNGALVPALASGYALLAERLGEPEPVVAVRSSALDEDSAASSFAGQHETVLGVRGLDALAVAVAACVASARSERAQAYRRRFAAANGSDVVPVLVQSLVVADVSLVAFSADPVSGRRDRILVDAAWGLGESVVGGTVTPDHYVLDAATLRPLERRVADKQRMTVLLPGRTREVAVPAALRRAPCLDDEQLARVGALVGDVAQHAGGPVDVEAAFCGDRLHLLQCRPITTISARSTT